MYTLHFKEIHLNRIWDDSRVVIPKVGVPRDVSLLIHTHFSTPHLDECLIQIHSHYYFFVLCLIVSFASRFHVDLKFNVIKLRVQTLRRNTRNVC